MPAWTWNAPKAKVQLRLSVQRLRTLQQKKEAQAKASRRDIASLIERGKIETARIKAETIINEDIHIELLELLELYSELLLARFGLLDQNTREPDPGISEGVCSIIYAAPRTELKELHILREILMHKYGREYSVAVMENRDNCVSERIVRKLGVGTPPNDLVDAYLTEIARGYGVEWTPPAPAYVETAPQDVAHGDTAENSDIEEESTKVDNSSTGDLKDKLEKKVAEDSASQKPPSLPSLPSQSKSAASVNEDDFDALARRFAELKKR